MACCTLIRGYLDHEEVLVDNTVVGETTHGGDLLVSHIKLGAALVAVVILLAHSVHLLVHLCSVMEAHLTRASHGPGDTGWMPGTNAGNLHMQSAISFRLSPTVKLEAMSFRWAWPFTRARIALQPAVCTC